MRRDHTTKKWLTERLELITAYSHGATIKMMFGPSIHARGFGLPVHEYVIIQPPEPTEERPIEL